MAKKVIVDAGHGGTDPGTSGNGIIEKDFNLKMSQYIYDRLKELGIETSMTRTGDETLNQDIRPKRAQSFYGSGSDVIILSNHINAGGGDGAEVIYALRNTDTLSKKIADELINSGQNVRKYYQRRLPSNPSKDYYYIHRDTPKNETVLIEYGFVDSSLDDVKQLKNDWEKMGEAVVKAVTEYAGGRYIPKVSITGEYHKVISGDTLYSIAKKYGVSVDDLKARNNLKTNTISLGQILYLPTKTEVPSTGGKTYTVKSGDTLWKIASQNNLSVDELKRLNNLTSNLLQVGQVLKLDQEPSDSTNIYIVKSGDTLYSIANRYKTTVDEIKRLNNLKTNTLSIGQKISLPTSSGETPASLKNYIVKSGDNLYSIAQKNNTTVNEIIQLNNLKSTLLSIGQTLKLP